MGHFKRIILRQLKKTKAGTLTAV